MDERLALLGDVHANLAALQAVLAAVAGAGITRGALTGDLVMRGSEPEPCVRLVRELGWPCVAGNTDRKVARGPDPAHPRAGDPGSRAWSAARLSPGSLEYLSSLPAVARLRVGRARVAVVHGRPQDPRDAVEATAPADDLRLLAADLEADCVVTGHTHRPFAREEDGVLFVNPGSVGEAEGGDLRPAWAWLEADGDGLRAHLERVPEPLAAVRRRR